MDRTTVWLSRLGVGALVGVVALLIAGLAAPTADAAVAMGYSSIDNPTGFAVIAEGDAMDGIVTASVASSATGTGVAAASTAAAGSVVATGWSGVPVAVGGALLIGTGGVVAAHLYAPKSSTTLTVATGGFHYNFAGGALQVSPYMDPTTGIGGVEYQAAGGTWEGETSYSDMLTKTNAYFGTRADNERIDLAFFNLAGAQIDRLTVYLDRGGWGAMQDDSGPFHIQAERAKSVPGAVRMTAQLSWLGTLPLQGYWESTAVHPTGLTGTLVTTVDCVSASGTRSFSTAVAATGAGDSAPLEWPGVTCNAGETLGHFTVDWVTETGTQNVYDYTAPGWVQTMPVEYPGCVDGGCAVELWKIVSGSPSLYCGVAAIGCPEWWADSGKADHFECRYGPYTAPLGLCAVFRQPGTVLPNTTIGLDPAGKVTGSPEPIISTNPDDFVNVPDPVPNPIFDPVPVVVGNPDPLPSIDSSQCMPRWGTFNPVEWILTPVKCALTWAFVPPAGSVEGITTGLRNDVGEKPPFSIVEPGIALVTSFSASRGNGTCSFGDFFPSQDGVQTFDCQRPQSLDVPYAFMVGFIWTMALWAAVKKIAAGTGNKESES